MFRVQVNEEEFDAARIGGEWWQRAPDEDDTAVFIVAAIKGKKKIDGAFYILAGGFEHEPRFISGVSGLRVESPQTLAEEGGAQQALFERSA